MSRLPAIQTEAATGKARELLEAVQAKLKVTLNMTRVKAPRGALWEGLVALIRQRCGGSVLMSPSQP